MGNFSNQSLKRTLKLFVLIVFVNIEAWGQVPSPPSASQCRQWDEAYLALFRTALWGMLIGSSLVSLFVPPLLGKQWWWATSPRLRILWTTLAIWLLVLFGIVLWPRLFGFGLWFSGIDPRYLECETSSFGATGLLDGLIGSGVATIAQWPAMVILLSAAAFIGGIAACGVSVILNRYLGIPARVKGGEA